MATAIGGLLSAGGAMTAGYPDPGPLAAKTLLTATKAEL